MTASPDTAAPSGADATPPPPQHPTHKLGAFIEKYSTFLSSFVLGLAGLVGTALYQSQQTKIAQKQADAQIAVSQNQAITQWKIARAEILSKNLQVLIDKKPETIDQRYGVLLSLTREDVLDPELAMSYAFDLANADYIKSVILNITTKNWAQIFNNFRLTCDLRYGVSREVKLCTALDKYSARAQAMGDVVSEELSRGNKDPLKLLADDRQVRSHLMRLVYLFEPYLRETYGLERLSDLESFESHGRGAQIVAAFVLAADPSGEGFMSSDAASTRIKFHQVRKQRLEQLLLDSACDAECRGVAAEMLLNGLPEYGAAYSDVLRRLLEGKVDSSQVVARLHRRLLWCQLAPEASARLLRDVLVPVWTELAHRDAVPSAGGAKEKSRGRDKEKEKEKEKQKQAEAARERAADAIVELASLIEVPPDLKLPESLARALEPRRARAKKERQTPPPSVRNANFCAAKSSNDSDSDEDL
jgi:hypothetical protein